MIISDCSDLVYISLLFAEKASEVTGCLLEMQLLHPPTGLAINAFEFARLNLQ